MFSLTILFFYMKKRLSEWCQKFSRFFMKNFTGVKNFSFVERTQPPEKTPKFFLADLMKLEKSKPLIDTMIFCGAEER